MARSLGDEGRFTGPGWDVVLGAGLCVASFGLMSALGFGGTRAGAAGIGAAALFGAFGPDLGRPGAPISYLFGPRGAYLDLWARRVGNGGAPTHSLLAVVVGCVLVLGPVAVFLGASVVLGPAGAFLVAFGAHLGIDALGGRHPVRPLWPREPAERTQTRVPGPSRGRLRSGLARGEEILRKRLKPSETAKKARKVSSGGASQKRPGKKGAKKQRGASPAVVQKTPSVEASGERRVGAKQPKVGEG